MSHTKWNLSDEDLDELLNSIGVSSKTSPKSSTSAAISEPWQARFYLRSFLIFFIGSALGFGIGRVSAPKTEIMPLLSEIKQAIDAASSQNKLQEIIEPLWAPEDNTRLAQKALV